jgi:hypothetical protein
MTNDEIRMTNELPKTNTQRNTVAVQFSMGWQAEKDGRHELVDSSLKLARI